MSTPEPQQVKGRGKKPSLAVIVDFNVCQKNKTNPTTIAHICMRTLVDMIVMMGFSSDDDDDDAETRDLKLKQLGHVLNIGRQLVVVHGDPELARQVGAHTTHLSANSIRSVAGGQTPPNLPFGASAHNAAELNLAHEIGADYAFLSPVAASISKAGHGPNADLKPLFAQAPLPTYALGGVTPANIPEWLDAGADGVVMLGAILDNPGQVINAAVATISDWCERNRSD